MPNSTLTKIIGLPSYDPIKTINDKLTVNACGVQTNLVCGTIDYARLTLTPGVYATISIAAWTPLPKLRHLDYYSPWLYGHPDLST